MTLEGFAETLQARAEYESESFPLHIRTNRISEVLALGDRLVADVLAAAEDVPHHPDDLVGVDPPVELEDGVGLYFPISDTDDLFEVALRVVSDAVAEVDQSATLAQLEQEWSPFLYRDSDGAPTITMMAIVAGSGPPETWQGATPDPADFEKVLAPAVEWWAELDGNAWLSRDFISVRSNVRFAKKQVLEHRWRGYATASTIAADGSSARAVAMDRSGQLLASWTGFAKTEGVAMGRELAQLAADVAPSLTYAYVVRTAKPKTSMSIGAVWGGHRPTGMDYAKSQGQFWRTVLDVVGLQLLTPGHVLPNHLPTGWTTTPLTAGRVLLEALDLSSWLDQVPTHEQLHAARAQFPDLLQPDR